VAGLTFIFLGHLRPPLVPPPHKHACGPNPRSSPQPCAAPSHAPSRASCTASRAALVAMLHGQPDPATVPPACGLLRPVAWCAIPLGWPAVLGSFHAQVLQQRTPVAMEATTFYSSRYKMMVFTILPLLYFSGHLIV
jgi:hypothetical protein